MNQVIGKWIIVIALVLLLIGLIIYLFGNKLNWIGNLPGDIRIERDNVRIYFPITTMLLLSVVLTILLNLLRRFFQG
ncbi:MAG: hypothetical protein KatS3mg030_402 [Saprospiraceae bacterium]|nr:MAG: hypothetical protein KatS3mg030_402 [Saprospiraceae bacterium]